MMFLLAVVSPDTRLSIKLENCSIDRAQTSAVDLPWPRERFIQVLLGGIQRERVAVEVPLKMAVLTVASHRQGP